jgi:hypothetical protein
MHISLTPELENCIKQKVASGYYNNASETGKIYRSICKRYYCRGQECIVTYTPAAKSNLLKTYNTRNVAVGTVKKSIEKKGLVS